MMCALCSIRSPIRRLTASIPDSAIMYTSLTATAMAVLALSLLLIIALPEVVSETLRVGCMDGMSAVEEH
jgi:hypothetical protein